MGRMRSLGLDVRIWIMPCEIEHPIRFEEYHRHAAYDGESANRFWRLLVQADRVLTVFRAHFFGQCRPGPFLLGQLRFGGDAVFRPPGANASRRSNIADKVDA